VLIDFLAISFTRSASLEPLSFIFVSQVSIKVAQQGQIYAVGADGRAG
jgi:hypothetical protein